MMQRAIALACAALGALSACTNAPTEPKALAVGLSVTSIAPVPASAAITGAGDSVVAVIVLPAACGYTPAADGQMTTGALVLRLSLTSDGALPTCLAINASTVYRLVAHNVPRASYDVSAEYRMVSDGIVSDSTLARQTIVLQ